MLDDDFFTQLRSDDVIILHRKKVISSRSNRVK